MAGLLALVLIGCGDETAEVGPPSSAPRPVVFPAGERIWAQRSKIHVGDQTFDLSPDIVTSLDWTPYALYVGLTDDPVRGSFREVEFDGKRATPLTKLRSDVVTSADGRYVAWVDDHGPLSAAGRLAQVVVRDARTDEVVFRSSEGMGGESGDDLGVRYEELPPGVLGIQGDTLYWRDAEGSGGYVTTDLTTGESTRSDQGPPKAFHPISGFWFSSPDGQHRIDAGTTGRLTVKPRQPDFNHRWQTAGNWWDEHTLVVLEQDRYRFSYDPRKPDHIAGFIEACNLDTGHCRLLRRVVGARDVVFPGVDVAY